MESCGGALWLARQIGALGHEVKLIASQYGKPFVKGNKNDFIDAEAICEAASRPTMRFCSIKTAEQQTLSALHCVRDSLISQRTVATTQIHGFLLEFGISLPVGVAALHCVPTLLDNPPQPVPLRFKRLVMRLYRQIQRFDRGEVAAGKQILECLWDGVAQLAAIAKVATLTQTDQGHHHHRFRLFAERAARLSSGG